MTTLAQEIGVTLPTDPTYWERAEHEYSLAANEIERLMIVEHGDRGDLAEAREALKASEAALMLGGLARPDGTPCKNEGERAAALMLACRADKAWCVWALGLRDAEVQAARTLAALERERDRRSLAKRRLDYVIARLRYLGADSPP